MSLRNILIAVIVLLGIAVVYKNFIKPATQSVKSNTTLPATTAEKIQLHPLVKAPPGEKQFQNYDQVRTYISSLKAEPIPADYNIPDYIKSGLERSDVYKEFQIRYPMFYGYGSTQLLDSIMAHPSLYEVMLTENKAIRRYYDPNSKY